MPSVSSATSAKLYEFLQFLGQAKVQFVTFPFKKKGRGFSWEVTRDNYAVIHQQAVTLGHNVYYSLAAPRLFGKKPRKEDLKSTQFVHVDLDPKPGVTKDNLLASVQRFPIAPSCIIDSGRGIQALWKLREPMALPEYEKEVEAVNLWLINAFNAGAGTHNVDRLLRLPYTINVGNEKTKGKLDLPTRILDINDKLYSLSDFPVSIKVKPTQATVGPADLVEVAEEYKLFSETVDLINRGHPGTWLEEYSEIYKTPTKDPNDRSVWVFHVTCDLVRKNVPDATIVSLLINETYKISAHVLDQKVEASKYALKQVNSAKAKVAAEAPRVPTMGASGPTPKLDLATNEKGGILKNYTPNIVACLHALGVTYRYDTLAQQCMVGEDPLDDAVLRDIWYQIEQLGCHNTIGNVDTCIKLLCEKNRYDPVLDYFKTLEVIWETEQGPWNGGESRLDGLLHNYFQAEDSPLNSEYGRLIMVAAAKRQLHPGSKFDEILVLKSPQGFSKSSGLEALCPSKSWFTDSLELTGDRKVTIETTAGKVLVEVADLAGLTRNQNKLKAFLSSTKDRAREAYARHARDIPRRFVLIGTTNDGDFLSDSTGNRRWWVVNVGRADVAAIERDRDLLWAEAYWRARQGESVRLDPSFWDASGERQREFLATDPWLEHLSDFLCDLDGRLLYADAWKLVGLDPERRDPKNAQRLKTAMDTLGWQLKKVKLSKKVVNAFEKGCSKQLITVRQDLKGNGYVVSYEAEEF